MLALLVATGCATGEDEPEDPATRVVQGDGGTAKAGTGERRTDLAPLTKRFDQLGDPASAVWMSGTLGEGRAPGPSSYWIDAVVTLAPGQGRALASRFRTTPTDERPDVVDDLVGEVPTGGSTTSDALDAAFSSDRWSTAAYLSAADDRLVLVARGQ